MSIRVTQYTVIEDFNYTLLFMEYRGNISPYFSCSELSRTSRKSSISFVVVLIKEHLVREWVLVLIEENSIYSKSMKGTLHDFSIKSFKIFFIVIIFVYIFRK